MTQLFLKIENPGVAPLEGLTLLGVSTTSSTNEDSTIGMFGSGFKHFINLFLRENLPVTVFLSNLRVSIYSKPKQVKDGLTVKNYNLVCYRLTGKDTSGKQHNKEIETGWVMEYGKHDWTDLKMGLREVVSNAIDRTIREEKPFSELKIEIVTDERAKSGTTRVFVPLTPDVQQFYNELHFRFLHFGHSDLEKQVLEKENTTPCRIYKKSVFVRETEKPSLFDYNLRELRLDESRNADDYQIRRCIGAVLNKSDSFTLQNVFHSLHQCELTMEATVASYDLHDYDDTAQTHQNWQTAWTSCFGERAVCCPDVLFVKENIARKGFQPVVIPHENWREAMKVHKIPTYVDLLNAIEQDGRTVKEPNEIATKACRRVWNILKEFDMLRKKEFPPVKMFQNVMNAETRIWGQYSNGTVYLNEDACESVTEFLLNICLEELAHHITGATDNSRDFQEFLRTFAIKLMKFIED